MRQDFDWGTMEWFLAIARTGRLTLAAQKLGIDHTTLSRRVKALEDALGQQGVAVPKASAE